MTERSAIPGSAPVHTGDAQWSPVPDTSEEITVTLILRGTAAAASIASSLLSGSSPVSQTAARQATKADPKDLTAVARFACEYGLTIVDENAAARTVHVRGTIAHLQNAFGVQLERVANASGGWHLSYAGEISVPESLSGIVVAVLGLDQRPIATHH